MSKRIPEETKIEIRKLYNEGASPAEIAKQTGVSYTSTYILTRGKERGYNSIGEYENYQARQRINPDTGEKFKSESEYNDYQARQRSKRKKNTKFAKLIKDRLKWAGMNQSELAKSLELSREAVRLYVYGINIPKGENLERLSEILQIPNKTLEEILKIQLKTKMQKLSFYSTPNLSLISPAKFSSIFSFTSFFHP